MTRKWLLTYKVQLGDCRVSQQYADNPKLGKEVGAQRTRYRKNKGKSHLRSQLSTFEHSMLLVSTGGQARLLWQPFGTNNLNNCANTRRSSVTASCHNGTPPTASSEGGWRVSAETISCARKENQIA